MRSLGASFRMVSLLGELHGRLISHRITITTLAVVRKSIMTKAIGTNTLDNMKYYCGRMAVLFSIGIADESFRARAFKLAWSRIARPLQQPDVGYFTTAT